MTKTELLAMARYHMRNAFAYDTMLQAETRRFVRRGLEYLADDAAINAERYFQRARKVSGQS